MRVSEHNLMLIKGIKVLILSLTQQDKPHQNKNSGLTLQLIIVNQKIINHIIIN